MIRAVSRAVRALTGGGSVVVLGAAVIGASLASPAGAAATSASGRLVTITVKTVPALPGIKLVVDGTPLWTDSAGGASYTAAHDFGGHTLTLATTSLSTRDRRYRFARWAGQRDPDQAFQPTVRGLPMRADYTVSAAFSVDVKVTARLVDQSGWPIDPGTAPAVTVRSRTGHLVDLPVNTATWVEASTPVYRKSMLGLSDISYALQRVTIAGSNAVAGAPQRFSPLASSTVTFRVGLHVLTIAAHDAMWGSRVGDAALVEGPDGTRRTVAFGPDGVARLTGLPRGTYRIGVRRPGGVVFTRQLSLGADHTIDVVVARWLDLALLIAGTGGVAAALLVVGRVRWRRGLHRPPAGREALSS
jgi:hypothetical protein